MKTNFDKQVICGQEYVALREIDMGDKIDVNGFVLTNTVRTNEKLGVFKVESIGKWAAEISGVKPGDIVYADRLSSFYHSSPVALMEIRNVIAKYSENGLVPLKNSVIVQEDETQEENVGGFYVAANKPRTGVIVSMGEVDEDFNFRPGDRVMLVKGGDCIEIGGKKMYAFAPEKIICKIVEK